jgi:hypothetical protein
MATNLSTGDRLDLLLGWLNDEDWQRSSRKWRNELPHRLSRFIRSFDGSAAAGHVRADVLSADQLGPKPSGTEELDEFEVLHTVLVDVLQRGFAHAEPFLADQIDLPNLRFGIERSAPQVIPKGKTALKRLRAQPGAYVLQVSGERLSLVVWLVMHMLTLPGAIDLKRCAAPRPYSTERCNRFFVPQGRGRIPEFCSEPCRQRNYWEPGRKGRSAKLEKRRQRRRKDN